MLTAVSSRYDTSQGSMDQSDMPITDLMYHSNPPSCKMVSCSGEAAVLFLFMVLEGVWRSWLFTPLQSGQLFSPHHNNCEIFLLIWKEKSNLLASRGCVWLPSIRDTGKSRHKVSLLPDALIPVSRSHHVICHEVQTVFLFNALGKLNQELVDSSLSPLIHTKSTAESLALLSSSYWKGCIQIQDAVISY